MSLGSTGNPSPHFQQPGGRLHSGLDGPLTNSGSTGDPALAPRHYRSVRNGGHHVVHLLGFHARYWCQVWSTLRTCFTWGHQSLTAFYFHSRVAGGWIEEICCSGLVSCLNRNKWIQKVFSSPCYSRVKFKSSNNRGRFLREKIIKL